MRWRSAVLVAAAASLVLACRSSSATDHQATAAPAGAPAKAPARAAALFRGRVLVPGGKSFDVEVVQDDLSRQRGLQHRARLAPGQGMVFIFPASGRHRFWMAECLIPIDIIWMDASRTVIHVEANVPACEKQPCPDYGPDADSVYVLEVGSGVARESGIGPGTKLTLLFDHPPNPS